MKKILVLKRIFLFNALMALVCFAAAQPGFKLEVSSHSIGRDEVLQVSYTVTNASQLNSRISVSRFPGWKIVSGPQTSQETSIINGVTSSSIGYIYLLMPEKAGTLPVPGASVIADGKKLSCPGTTVHVSNQGGGASSGGPSPSANAQSSLQALLDQLERQDNTESSNVLHKGESALQKIKDNMFVRATPSKHSVYVGEPFAVTYQLYSALGGQSKVTKQPSFNGVSVTEITRESDPEVVTVGNKKYRAFLIRKVQLTPLQPGPISLGIMETSNEVPFASYDDPYHTQTYTQLIQNPAVTVTAKPLPDAGRPAGFSGAIGHFTIRVIPQSQSVPVGENDVLHVEITGDGNLLSAAMPDYKWPEGIDHYDAKDSQHVDKGSFPLKVSKVFKVPFVGTREGKATFGPISFSYFDPDAGTYKTVQSDPFTIDFTHALPKASRLGDSLGIDLSGDILYWAGGAVVLLILVIILVSSAKRKGKKAKQTTVASTVQADASAPWNVEATPTSNTGNTVPAPIVPSSDSVAKENPATEETVPEKADFGLELQSIMLSTDKSDMYAKGNDLIVKVLASYLATAPQSKDHLIQQLADADKPSVQKENILSIINSLNDQINKGLYSPLFSEADKIAFIDGLNMLLQHTGCR